MTDTRIATSDATTITMRGRNLVDELVGRHSFTEILYFLMVGRMPDRSETRVLDACLVTLMEHGLNPSSLIARLMADSVPDQIQVAIGTEAWLSATFSQEPWKAALVSSWPAPKQPIPRHFAANLWRTIAPSAFPCQGSGIARIGRTIPARRAC